MEDDGYTVTDNPDEHRYEIRGDGAPAGVAEYILTGGVMVFTHTQVGSPFAGRGLGSRLVRGALDDVRARNLRVIPVCPYVKGWIGRHPDYADLLYDAPASEVHD
ncbi:hypothetical protein FHX37_4157 [Haloactinospora alba]|uniref:N-acetyltransferase domain-containing protein n=1 Tax=Haloactinospora alba TaxID=405555 RepID=A0A543NAC6_9ACTN|nr:GNAT family N-acetyltransferase [Haloactinospora alba]TQN28792.1 hypothetical protein FHX37_4157 [Haloactinospora alba]